MNSKFSVKSLYRIAREAAESICLTTYRLPLKVRKLIDATLKIVSSGYTSSVIDSANRISMVNSGFAVMVVVFINSWTIIVVNSAIVLKVCINLLLCCCVLTVVYPQLWAQVLMTNDQPLLNKKSSNSVYKIWFKYITSLFT